LRDVISSFYNIPIIGVELDVLHNNLTSGKWSFTGVSEKEPVIYKKLLDMHLQQLEKLEEGVTRLHPTQLSLIPTNGKLLDFDLFNFKQYNKIYFTARVNVADAVSSLFIAHSLNKYTYKSLDELEKHIEPKEFTEDSYNRVFMLLYADLISKHLKAYLTKASIEWEHIDHDDVPKFIEQNYNNISSSNIETNFNYKDLVTNYNELVFIYEKLKNVAMDRFYQANPHLDI